MKVLFFPSKNHDRLNGAPFNPELLTGRACLNPYYKATVKGEEIVVILDSGAFQDVKGKRLSFEGALERQLEFEKAQSFMSSLLVSYDRLVDEQINNEGKQIKSRVDWKTGEKFVEETINASKYISDRREELAPRKLVLSNQGTTTQQYLDCLKEILTFAEPQDIIGLGGFCIIGQKPSLVPQYFKIVKRAIPLIRDKGIKQVHVFGVGTIPILEKTALITGKYGMTLSYDTSAYELNGVLGKVFSKDTKKTKKVYTKEQKFVDYNPNQQAHDNIKAVKEFWDEVSQTTLWNFEDGVKT